MFNHHCFYSVVTRLTNKNGHNLKECDVFNLMGGHSFRITKKDNGYFPYVEFCANKISTEIFKNMTGIKLVHETFKNGDFEIQKTMNNLKKVKNQVVLTNCFHLPYDSINYKKRKGNHYIMIHSYNQDNDTFLVSDNKYETVIIEMNDLMLAMNNQMRHKDHVVFLNYEEDFIESNIIDGITRIIRLNAIEILETCEQQFVELKEHLKGINELDPLEKSLSYFEMIHSIKSFNGPILSKNYLLQSLQKKNIEIDKKLIQSIGMWERLCFNFYKIYQFDMEIDLNNSIDKLLKLELSINNRLLNN